MRSMYARVGMGSRWSGLLPRSAGLRRGNCNLKHRAILTALLRSSPCHRGPRSLGSIGISTVW
jgi:hypothetical protein